MPSPSKEPKLRILLVTDAWAPQINGVVVTLRNTVAWLERWGHEVHVLSPEGFRTFPMPTYPEIPLAIFPAREVNRRIATLARLELNIMFEETLRRYPAMEPAGRPTAVESGFVNQLKTLPVRLDDH